MLKQVSIFTDADQGIGIELVKLLSKRFDGAFYFTSRDANKGLEAVAALNEQGLNLEYHQLDISDRHSIETFRDYIQKKYGGINMLINNVSISSSVQVCDSYDAIEKILKDYYYDFVTVQNILFPLLKKHAKVIYVMKQGQIRCVRNQYWSERLSMKHLKKNDINDFLQWCLDGMKSGTFEWDDYAEDRAATLYRIAHLALTMLVSLQRKDFLIRSINMDFMSPTWTFKKVASLSM